MDLGVRSTGVRSDVGFKILVWEDDRIADLRGCGWVSWKMVRSCTGESCKVQRSRSEILQYTYGAYSLRSSPVPVFDIQLELLCVVMSCISTLPKCTTHLICPLALPSQRSKELVISIFYIE